jgi:hypothetical protein
MQFCRCDFIFDWKNYRLIGALGDEGIGYVEIMVEMKVRILFSINDHDG